MKQRSGALGLVIVCLVSLGLIVWLSGCEPGGPPPPPITLPPLPVVKPISQCTEVFPDTYTRPIKTNHPWSFLAVPVGVRAIRWLDQHCDRWWQGPYDPAHPLTACAYHPQEGDRYYSERDGFVDTPPLGCPQST